MTALAVPTIEFSWVVSLTSGVLGLGLNVGIIVVAFFDPSPGLQLDAALSSGLVCLWA